MTETSTEATAPAQPEAPPLGADEISGTGDTVKITHGEGETLREAYVTRQQADVVYVPLGWTITEASADELAAAATPATPDPAAVRGGTPSRDVTTPTTAGDAPTL